MLVFRCLVPCFREYLNLQMVFVYHFLRAHQLMFSRTFNYAYIHRVDGNHLLALYIFLYAVFVFFSHLFLPFAFQSFLSYLLAFFILLLDAWLPRCLRSVINLLPVLVRNVEFPSGLYFKTSIFILVLRNIIKICTMLFTFRRPFSIDIGNKRFFFRGFKRLFLWSSSFPTTSQQ